MVKKLMIGVVAASAALTLASCNKNGGDFTIFLYQENTVYDEDMPVFKRANEYAEINLEGVLQKYDSNYDNIYTTEGKNASIVVNDQDTIESTALNEGIFKDLTDLINETNTPNLYNYFETHAQQKEWATASDGRIYGIPFYTEGETAKGYFVRMDWIKHLDSIGKLPKGLKPTVESLNQMNVVQYEELLRAIKDNHASLASAGLADRNTIYPYFDRDSDFAISAHFFISGGAELKPVYQKIQIVLPIIGLFFISNEEYFCNKLVFWNISSKIEFIIFCFF